MGFLSFITDPISDFVGDLTGANNLADAQRAGSGVIQGNIQQGLGEQSIAQGLAQGQLQGGIDQNLGFLNQARGQFGTAAGLTDPALGNLQATGTAGGRASALQAILSDPNQQALFGQVADQTANQLSGMGLRRSGFGVDTSQQNQMNFASQLLNQQDASQQNLANMGMGANNAIANLLANSGSIAGQGGANLANLTQQGSANRLNMLGQLGQAQAAGITGPAQTQANSMQSILGLGGQLGGAMLGRSPGF